VRAEGYSGGNAGSVQTFYFLRERLAPGATTPALDELDAVIVLSPGCRRRRSIRGIDPLASAHACSTRPSSARRTPPWRAGTRGAPRGARHRGAPPGGGSEPERTLVTLRAEGAAVFGQPFYITEPYTGRPGTTVSRQETVAHLRGDPDGAHDDMPEEPSASRAGIDEVRQRAGR